MSADQSRTPTQGQLVAVGVVTGAHGIRGQIKVRSFTTNPHDILAYGALLNKTGTRRFDLSIDADTKAGLVCSLKGVNDRNAAELLKGTELFANKNRMPEAGDDEFYIDELQGLEVRSGSGEKLGVVSEVVDFGAGDILEIKLASNGKKELYPFTAVNFPDVKVSEGYIVADLPEIVEAKGKQGT